MSNSTTTDKCRLRLAFYSAYVHSRTKGAHRSCGPSAFSTPDADQYLDLQPLELFAMAQKMEHLLDRMDLTSRQFAKFALKHIVEGKVAQLSLVEAR